mmetsp:Transcript_36962/g.80023  ORF Transcript_36962/g.80023 Transcript_36962/m.80023 type:complete len:121 (-) Transcript_36962:1103-1465(-)
MRDRVHSRRSESTGSTGSCVMTIIVVAFLVSSQRTQNDNDMQCRQWVRVRPELERRSVSTTNAQFGDVHGTVAVSGVVFDLVTCWSGTCTVGLCSIVVAVVVIMHRQSKLCQKTFENHQR